MSLQVGVSGQTSFPMARFLRTAHFSTTHSLKRTNTLTPVNRMVKTPQMGESITEGTLTQWLRNTGEFVHRDEHIATIETDKVNAPESGTLLSLFAKEGDTVQVGNDLFNLDTDAAQPDQTSNSAPDLTSEPEPEHVVSPVATPVHKQHRTPLIRFLGPRKLLSHDHSAAVTQPAQPTSKVVNGTRVISYDSLVDMPLKYQYASISQKEMDIIDAGGAF